ncbi:MAG TPA: chemotaxis response regulator protein-glutamate methylesterase [Candidatus Acidoferrales bacterium]|nr:chemotaxis response regulator protein-glutamate methylesterase [Candidatus Acidoferrales bacterium]
MNPAAKKIRVLIVDDSTFMRKVLQEIISSDPQLEVAGQAKDGREAIAMADSLKPDVVTMDINMPRMDGLQATEHIMSQNPRPIVVVSSESRDGAASTLCALELGAIEFVPKPSSGIDLDLKSVGDDLNRKLKMAAKVRVVRTAARVKPHLGGVRHSATHSSDSRQLGASTGNRFPVVVMAASTGGPAAIMRLAPGFPKDFPAAVLLVQHMPPAFTSQYAVQLAEVADLEVKEAEPNEPLRPGVIYVCPGSHHLRITSQGRISLDDGPRIGGYRPCADVAMESVAAFAGSMTVGVVLTGMGNDASRGVQSIKSAGGAVLAQDEATAVIFGMPAEAIKTGAVDQVLPLDQICPAIDKRIRRMAPMSPVGAR